MANQSRKYHVNALKTPVDVYYLFVLNDENVQCCVKIAGEIQATAAYHFIKQKMAHLLAHGKSISYSAATDCDIHRQNELESFALSTYVRLLETEVVSDSSDVFACFAYAVLDFFHTESTIHLSIAPEMNGATPGLMIPGNTDTLKSATPGMTDSGGTNQGINGIGTVLKVNLNNPECITEPFAGVIEPIVCRIESVEKRLDQPVPVIAADGTVLPIGDQTPYFETDGSFRPISEFAIVTGYKESTLKKYREKALGVKWLDENKTLGKTRHGGHYIRKVDPDNERSEWEYFLFHDEKKNICFMK